jgi:exopolyphosphatase/guanosine-5'-triphosphate,3'-diphosphate pyrophosphatase
VVRHPVPQAVKAAAIDIGTNTVLLLVAEVEGGRIRELRTEQRIPRLGKGVDAAGNLAPDRMLAVIEALVEYRDIIAEYGQMEVVVSATSAVRDAANRIEFLWLAEEATGYRIRILTGEEEADTTFTGALSMMDATPAGPWVVIDIGGGSTELILADGDRRLTRQSFNVGSVRLSERNRWVPPLDRESVRNGVRDLTGLFRDAGFDTAVGLAVGVAGTAGVMKALAPDLRLDTLEAMLDEWCGLTPESLLARHPEVLRGREDVILAGLAILVAAMRAAGTGELTVSAGGIRHGLLLKALNEEGR